MAVWGVLCLIVIGLLAPGLYNGLKIRRYTIETEALGHRVRIALVTDLHSCRYGENEQVLIDAIHAENPDILLLGGDIFDDQLPDTNVVWFLAGIADRYPCYYVTGNHEYWSGEQAFAEKMAILERFKIVRLIDESVTVSIQGETLHLYGVDDPDAEMISSAVSGRRKTPSEQAADWEAFGAKDGYTVLLAHRPGPLRFYAACGIDLALCGHTHGGQWRIPGLLNGLFAPDQGLFPRYAGGRYEENGTIMIVSRGLALESTGIPRFYNRPELVIIDLV